LNKPSKVDRQREHQANERTFLAWLRTSVSLIGFGLALARFGLFMQQLQPSSTPRSVGNQLLSASSISIGLVVVGILLLVLALWNYSQVFHQIERADYRPNPRFVWLTGGAVLVLGTLSLIWILLRMAAPPAQPNLPQNQRSLEE
jgi:putative membrane protein